MKNTFTVKISFNHSKKIFRPGSSNVLPPMLEIRSI